MNKRTLKAMLLSLCVFAANPMNVSAKESFINYDADDLKEKAKEYGKRIVEEAEKIDQKINDKVVDPAKDKLSDITLYDENSLWLVTDIPGADPSIERHYFFVNKNFPLIKTTTHFDFFGNKVKRDDVSAIRKYEKKLYASLTNADDTFLAECNYSLQSNIFSNNYVFLDTDEMWIENCLTDYGVFNDVSIIIPEDKRKDKYSTKDLEEIIEIVNDVNYEFGSISLERTR